MRSGGGPPVFSLRTVQTSLEDRRDPTGPRVVIGGLCQRCDPHVSHHFSISHCGFPTVFFGPEPHHPCICRSAVSRVVDPFGLWAGRTAGDLRVQRLDMSVRGWLGVAVETNGMQHAEASCLIGGICVLTHPSPGFTPPLPIATASSPARLTPPPRYPSNTLKFVW